MQPLPTEATIQEKTNTCTDQRRPTYHLRSQIIQDNVNSCINIHQHRRRRGDKKISNGQGSLGHWHLKLWTQWTVVTQCLVSSFWCLARCIVGERRVFPDLKNKHKSIYSYFCGYWRLIVQELCESRGDRPGLSVLTSLMVSVDVKLYWTVLTHGLSLSLIFQPISEDIKLYIIISWLLVHVEGDPDLRTL